jgi:hypothetical protein
MDKINMWSGNLEVKAIFTSICALKCYQNWYAWWRSMVFNVYHFILRTNMLNQNNLLLSFIKIMNFYKFENNGSGGHKHDKVWQPKTLATFLKNIHKIYFNGLILWILFKSMIN